LTCKKTDADFRRLPQSSGGTIMTKRDLLARIYNHKKNLYNGHYEEQTEEWSEGAHHMLNKMLELAQEYGD
tara:strand:+ start:165 stop:377 length:213 start_codon:yes stop_codon:yes gene_type:complete